MALNDIRFDFQGGGLNRQADGEDHISALLFDDVAAPGGWGADKMRDFVDVEQVKQSGITEGDAVYGIVYYQAKEFFRLRPGATLWVCFEIDASQDLIGLAGGRVRQIGMFIDDLSDLQSEYQSIADALDTEHAPVHIVAAYSGPGLALGGLSSLEGSLSPNVSVLIAGDGAAEGAALAASLGLAYVPALGAALGAVALANVHESIAWVDRFNLSDGSELETIRLADGENNPSTGTLTQLDTKRFLVFRKHSGVSGTYFNDSHTATAATDDLAYIESVRTINKAKRLIRTRLLPYLNAPLTVNDDGTLQQSTVRFYEDRTSQALNQMLSAGEISAFVVLIDPAQNVLSTSKLTIQVRIVPVGVARNIIIPIGYAVNVTA